MKKLLASLLCVVAIAFVALIPSKASAGWGWGGGPGISIYIGPPLRLSVLRLLRVWLPTVLVLRLSLRVLRLSALQVRALGVSQMALIGARSCGSAD